MATLAVLAGVVILGPYLDLHAEPGHAGFMAGDAGERSHRRVIHRCACEGGEIGGGVTALACHCLSGNVRRRRGLGHDISEGQACAVTLDAIVGDAGMAHLETRNNHWNSNDTTCKPETLECGFDGLLVTTGGKRDGRGVAVRALTGRGVIRVLGLRRPIDHGDAEPGGPGLMASRATGVDARVAHGSAGPECREIRRRVAVFARRARWDMVRRLFLRNDVGETQSLAMAYRAVVGDALVTHLEDGVIRRVRVTQRAGLRGRYVIGRLGRHATGERCRRRMAG